MGLERLHFFAMSYGSRRALRGRGVCRRSPSPTPDAPQAGRVWRIAVSAPPAWSPRRG